MESNSIPGELNLGEVPDALTLVFVQVIGLGPFIGVGRVGQILPHGGRSIIERDGLTQAPYAVGMLSLVGVHTIDLAFEYKGCARPDAEVWRTHDGPVSKNVDATAKSVIRIPKYVFGHSEFDLHPRTVFLLFENIR